MRRRGNYILQDLQFLGDNVRTENGISCDNCWRNGSQLGESSMTPMRGIFPAALCARTTTDHAVAEPAIALMSSRLLIADPEAQDKASCRLKLSSRKAP